MARPKTPSIAQAKRLARLFQSDGHYAFSSEIYTSDTDAALIRAGWVSFAGDTTYPNGAPAKQYRINDSGLEALERYLRARRVSATLAPSPAEGDTP